MVKLKSDEERRMTQPDRSPAELRNMFGANLRHLAAAYPSISELSRQLGINRTQFNRYLSGESFPRPDVLARICNFFKVDARVLLEPVEQLGSGHELLNAPLLAEFVGASVKNVTQEMFPDGFYRFSRRSFVNDELMLTGLVHVFRKDTNTYLRGFEPKEAMRQQGLPTDTASREFRGFIMHQEDGIAAVVSRRHAMTCSFNYLSRVASYENNYWVGFVTRTVRESVTSTRITRMVYEHIGQNTKAALKFARTTGFCGVEDLLPFHRRLLQLDEPFR